MTIKSLHTHTHRVLTVFADQGDTTEFVIPEDLSSLSDADLTTLIETATGHFRTMYGDGEGLSTEDLVVLSALTDGIETLNAEAATRAKASGDRAAEAAALAARVAPEVLVVVEDEGGAEDEGEDEPDAEPDPVDPPEEPEGVQASARKGTRVTLNNLHSRSTAHRPALPDVQPPKGIKDVLALADTGQGADWMDVAKVLDRRLTAFNHQAYSQAAASGRSMREQSGLAVITKRFVKEQTVFSNDQDHIAEVIKFAVDQKRTPRGSLVASGGWGAPSQVVYDFLEFETRAGLISLPEIHVARGGLIWTLGPDFSTIFADTGFSYTEVQDISGLYVPGSPSYTAGDKPVYKVEMPRFEEERLAIAGLAITAGLLAARGYPEVLARVLRGALIAHDHKMAARYIGAICQGSTDITMNPEQVGALEPILTAIELQAQHMRTQQRMDPNTVLEAVFPNWVMGLIRADLGRRLGAEPELISITDQVIQSWFADRHISAQFVYNWQDIGTTAAGTFIQWPTTVEFLLYPAGTWVKGTADVITVDTIYDSVNLRKNDFTALFTEEGWMMLKRFADSRQVIVNVEATGATSGGVNIQNDGSYNSHIGTTTTTTTAAPTTTTTTTAATTTTTTTAATTTTTTTAH